MSSIVVRWALHWLTVILVGLTFAFWLPECVLSLVQTKGHFWHSAHITLGFIVLVLAIIRLLHLFIGGQHKAESSKWRVARAIQAALILVLILTAIAGYLSFRQPVLGTKILLFGAWPLNDFTSLGAAQTARLLHEMLSYGLILLIAVHILIGLLNPKRFQFMLWPW